MDALQIAEQAAICERRQFPFSSRARLEPRGRVHQIPYVTLVIEPEQVPELVRERRVVGVVSDRADAELLCGGVPSEPTNRRTSSRLTAFFIGKSLASMRKPSSSRSSDPFGASTGSDVVFRSRNSISAAPNILFTSLNDDISEAALRIVLISRVR